MSKFELKQKAIPLQIDIATNKAFSYRKGDTSLNFQLKFDDGGKQLKDFKECLTAALKDITEMLEG